MNPIIYPSDETTFTSRGYGTLADCISCTVPEVLNGEYSLTLKYPKNGINQEYLDIRNIIVCQPNHTTERDAFRISKVNRSMKDSITVYAYQLSYDLNGYVVFAYGAGITNDTLYLRESAPDGNVIMMMESNTTLMILGSTTISSNVWYHVRLEDGTEGWCLGTYVTVTALLGTYPWTVNSLEKAIDVFNLSADNFEISTNKTSSASFTVNMPSSVRSWFGGKEGSLIDIYGGEWAYNFFNCSLLSRRGSDNGARLSYGVNLAEYIKERTDKAYSDIVPYFYRKSGDTEIVVKGDAVATGYTGTQKSLILDVTDKFESNYGKEVPIKMATRLWKSGGDSSGAAGTPWENIDENGLYYTEPAMRHYYDWASVQSYTALSNDSFTFQGTTLYSPLKMCVALPIKIDASTRYEFRCSCTNGLYVRISYANADFSKLSDTTTLSVSNNMVSGAFTTPSNAVWAVIVFEPTTMTAVSTWNDINITSKPSVADVTAQGTAYLSAHPELSMDSQTISIKPELVNTEVSLGDTVHVAYDDTLISTRVVKTVWNVLAEKYDTLEIGTVKENIATTIKNLRR